jgi:hypothetical protein
MLLDNCILAVYRKLLAVGWLDLDVYRKLSSAGWLYGCSLHKVVYCRLAGRLLPIESCLLLVGWPVDVHTKLCAVG